MKYMEAVAEGMNLLAAQPNAVILGQSVAYKGNVIFKTIGQVPMEKRIEMPVFEDTQMGLSIGLAMAGFLPISVFPRFNFLLLATNQLVNHLDKIAQISHGGFNPKVIIKTMVGSVRPLHPGIQHCGDFTAAFRSMLTNVVIEELHEPEDVVAAHQRALDRPQSTLLVEFGDHYAEK